MSHLFEGLRLGLVGSLEKRSQILGRDAVWTKTSAVAKLSPYLCVQYMRFFWKATPDSADHVAVRVEIKVQAPFNFGSLGVRVRSCSLHAVECTSRRSCPSLS